MDPSAGKAEPLAPRARSLAAALAALRDGSWLTTERRRLVCWLVLLASALLLFGLHATARGLLDGFGRPLGTDYSQGWVAGRAALAGDPAGPYDHALHWARQKEAFGPEAEFYGWYYPPTFLLPSAALALLPYWPSLLVWLAATLALYAATVRSILPGREALLVALAFPAVFINAGHGNNAFLTTALIGGGLVLLPRRPVLAGLLFGLVSYKPQFGILLPLALLAAGSWRTLASAAASTLLLAAASVALFGWAPWQAFVDGLAFTRKVVLEEGGVGFHRLQSAFAAVRLPGGSVALASLAQAAVTLAMAAFVWAAWRRPLDPRLKGAILIVASLLATPYLFDYDLVLLAVAGAFWVSLGLERGFRPWEISALAAAWAMPLVARTMAEATHVPLGFLVLLALAGLLARRLSEASAQG
ncbi:MAG: glycosyltransferase family 87 protein [Alsobacter sp.]